MDNSTTAVILAAGESKRLGQPKALLKLGEKSLIDFIISRLEILNLDIIIVTNKKLFPELEKFNSNKITLIIPENTEHRTGNLIAGVKSIENPNKILVVPVDRPGWSTKTIKTLLSMEETCCPEFNGKGGHPLLICKSDVFKLINSSVKIPLNEIFYTKKIKVNDPYLHLNIDTENDIIKLNDFYDKYLSKIR